VRGARETLESMGHHYPLLIQTLKEREDMFLMQERTIVALSTLFRRIGSPVGLDWSLWPDVLSGKATDL